MKVIPNIKKNCKLYNNEQCLFFEYFNFVTYEPSVTVGLPFLISL